MWGGYDGGMDVNRYESPQEAEGYKSGRNILGLRRKPWWGYLIALVGGAFIIGGLLNPFLAALDDAGGVQMLVGGFLGVVIYGLLFPINAPPSDRPD